MVSMHSWPEIHNGRVWVRFKSVQLKLKRKIQLPIEVEYEILLKLMHVEWSMMSYLIFFPNILKVQLQFNWTNWLMMDRSRKFDKHFRLAILSSSVHVIVWHVSAASRKCFNHDASLCKYPRVLTTDKCRNIHAHINCCRSIHDFLACTQFSCIIHIIDGLNVESLMRNKLYALGVYLVVCVRIVAQRN